MITTLFFDLDGTLLPMDIDQFTHLYLKSIATTLARQGLDPQELPKNILKSLEVIFSQDHSRTNEEVFWDSFKSIYGPDIIETIPAFEAYYKSEFAQCQVACPANPEIPSVIKLAQKLGFRIVLATNPVFPRIAVEERLKWAGLNPDDFEWITTYENSHYSKPDPHYFLEIAQAIQVAPEEILMIGNDMREDYGAIKAGMHLFILTDCLIPYKNHSLSTIEHGNVSALKAYLSQLSKDYS